MSSINTGNLFYDPNYTGKQIINLRVESSSDYALLPYTTEKVEGVSALTTLERIENCINFMLAEINPISHEDWHIIESVHARTRAFDTLDSQKQQLLMKIGRVEVLIQAASTIKRQFDEKIKNLSYLTRWFCAPIIWFKQRTVQAIYARIAATEITYVERVHPLLAAQNWRRASGPLQFASAASSLLNYLPFCSF